MKGLLSILTALCLLIGGLCFMNTADVPATTIDVPMYAAVPVPAAATTQPAVTNQVDELFYPPTRLVQRLGRNCANGQCSMKTPAVPDASDQTAKPAATTDNPENYAEARRQLAENGCPMLLMVSARSCGPCQSMKRNVLPKLRERGIFRRVAFAEINADQEAELAQQLTGGGPVPQLVLYRKTDTGWLRRKAVGYRSAEQIEQFVNEELAADESAKLGSIGKTLLPTAISKPSYCGTRSSCGGCGCR